MFAKSAVKRIGRARFLRNVLIAIGNSGDWKLAPILRALMDDESPLLRGASLWALGELGFAQELRSRAADNLAVEIDEGVKDEWRAYLGDAEDLAR